MLTTPLHWFAAYMTVAWLVAANCRVEGGTARGRRCVMMVSSLLWPVSVGAAVALALAEKARGEP